MIVPARSSHLTAEYFCRGHSVRHASARANSMLVLKTTFPSSLLDPQIELRDAPLVSKTFTYHHTLSRCPPIDAARPLLKSP